MVSPTVSFGKSTTRSELSRAAHGTAKASRQQPRNRTTLFMASLPGSFLRHFEMLVEEFDRCAIRGQPGSMQKEIMNFIGKNQLFKLDVLFAQSFGQVDGFRERNVAVVIALDQENGRTPGTDGGKWRRLPC